VENLQGEDYIRLHQKMEANNATIIKYHISIDMAKELSMLQNNEKGKENEETNTYTI
jgi:phage anti-repressor protein